MNKYSVLYFILLLTIPSCFKEYQDNDSLITHKKDFIAGLLVPDSSVQFKRSYPTQIFVGQICPANRKNKYTIKSVDDPLLYDLLYGTRQWYRVFYEYDSTSRVILKSESDSVEMTYCGNGIYKDLYRTLKIKEGKSYQIYVNKKDGKKYTSFTTVPDYFQIIQPEKDTIKLIPENISGSLWASKTDIKITYNKKPTYFIIHHITSNFGLITNCVLDTNTNNLIAGFAFQKSGFDTTRIDLIEAYLRIYGVDNNLAKFYDPVNTAGSNDFWNFLDSLEKLSIYQRSNIQGDDDVVGVFGSYNAAVKRFTAIALWDSIKLNQRKGQ